MNKKSILASVSIVLLSLPVIVFAIPNPAVPQGGLLDPISLINEILNLIWPFFMGFAVIMFLVAGFNFLSAQGDPGKVRDARNAVIFGAVGVIVGVAAFSLPFVLAAL